MKLTEQVREFGLLRGAALAAATLISFDAESRLAMLSGVSHGVSYALPVAVDALMIASLRSRRKAAIIAASLMMAAANATSHLLTDGASGTDPRIVASVSVIPVVVIMLLELLVPAVGEKALTQVPAELLTQFTEWRTKKLWELPANAPLPRVETVTVPHPVAHYIPVTLDETEFAALAASLLDEAEAVTQDAADEAADETPRLSDDDARRMAEDAYAAGNVSARAAAKDVTRSPATVNRWYREFEKQGVRRLAVAK